CGDAEAFSKAKQKLGSVKQLGAEFAKENLLKIWRDRVFWMTGFAFILQLLDMAIHPLFDKLAPPVSTLLGLSQSWILLAFLDAIPALLVAIAMATGFAEIIFRRLHWIFARRGRIALAGVIGTLGAAYIANRFPDSRGNLPYAVICTFAYLAFAAFI